MTNTRWGKLTTIQKRVTMLAALLAGLLAIVGSAWAGISIIATDSEVDTKIAVVTTKFDLYVLNQHTKDIKKELRDLRFRLEDVEYRLLNPQLPAVQKAALNQSKIKLLRRIECIQTERTYCE